MVRLALPSTSLPSLPSPQNDSEHRDRSLQCLRALSSPRHRHSPPGCRGPGPNRTAPALSARTVRSVHVKALRSRKIWANDRARGRPTNPPQAMSRLSNPPLRMGSCSPSPDWPAPTVKTTMRRASGGFPLLSSAPQEQNPRLQPRSVFLPDPREFEFLRIFHHRPFRGQLLFLSLNGSCKFRFDLLNGGQAGFELFRKGLRYLPLPLRYSYRFPVTGKRVFNDRLILLFNQQKPNTRLVVRVPEQVIHDVEVPLTSSLPNTRSFHDSSGADTYGAGDILSHHQATSLMRLSWNTSPLRTSRKMMAISTSPHNGEAALADSSYQPIGSFEPTGFSRWWFRCAQHGRDLGGESPPVSWPQRAKRSTTAQGRPNVGRKCGTKPRADG